MTANTFAALKKQRKASFEKLGEQLQEVNKGGFQGKDEDLWKLEVDKAGNGYAVIRFLPAPPEEDNAFVRLWSHGFQGPGGWFIENSLTTLGQDDPVSEYNSKLWNEDGSDDAKAQVRKMKRRLSFYSNIYIVKDPANPENEGKVMKYRYGKKIFDMLNDAMYPQFPDTDPINPFDMWEGANFMLKQRKVDGYANYDKSDFGEPGRMVDPEGNPLTDAQMEEIWNQQHSLKDIVAEDKFKSYNELKQRLNKVLGLDGSRSSSATVEDDEDDGDRQMDFKPNFDDRKKDAPKGKTKEVDTDTGEDDDLDFFADLADE